MITKAPKSQEEVLKAIESNTYSLPDLVAFYLKNIEERASLNAFLEVFTDEVLEKSREIQSKIEQKSAGKLAGFVIGLKDNLCYKGHKVSASSKILENFESIYTATAIQRLLDEDALIIGRLNCDEFAMGSSNETSAYGAVKNPLNEDFVPGGSSGGSAAAVAGNLCLAALGSDTGGSIRQPASFCGTVGLKPSYGRISRYGLLAYGSSLDQIGPLTNNVADAEILLEVMSGNDEFDTTASTKGKYVPQSFKSSDKFKIAYSEKALNHPKLDIEIKNHMLGLIETLKAEGHEINTYEFELIDYLVPAYYVLCNAEASSNLSRYDGIHYGYRSEKSGDIFSTYEFSRTEGFGTEVKRRIMMGTFVLSAGYYDAYYAKAQKVRRMIKEQTEAIFEKNDFILLPSSPNTAFKHGAIKDPVSMYLEDIFTVQANLCGIPGISLPLGQHSNGLPFGVQILANKFEESKMLYFSKNLMKFKLS